jgi:hypothetical protein
MHKWVQRRKKKDKCLVSYEKDDLIYSPREVRDKSILVVCSSSGPSIDLLYCDNKDKEDQSLHEQSTM